MRKNLHRTCTQQARNNSTGHLVSSGTTPRTFRPPGATPGPACVRGREKKETEKKKRKKGEELAAASWPWRGEKAPSVLSPSRVQRNNSHLLHRRRKWAGCRKKKRIKSHDISYINTNRWRGGRGTGCK